jgi:hypothetical protein
LGGGATTLSLSNNTRITFQNVAGVSLLQVHIESF